MTTKGKRTKSGDSLSSISSSEEAETSTAEVARGPALRRVSCHMAQGAVAQHRGEELPNRDRYGNITIQPPARESWAFELTHEDRGGKLPRASKFAKG